VVRGAGPGPAVSSHVKMSPQSSKNAAVLTFHQTDVRRSETGRAFSCMSGKLKVHGHTERDVLFYESHRNGRSRDLILQKPSSALLKIVFEKKLTAKEIHVTGLPALGRSISSFVRYAGGYRAGKNLCWLGFATIGVLRGREEFRGVRLLIFCAFLIGRNASSRDRKLE